MVAFNGPVVRVIRTHHNVPLHVVGAKSRRSPGHLNKVERGERPLSAAVQAAYEEAIGMPLDKAAQALRQDLHALAGSPQDHTPSRQANQPRAGSPQDHSRYDGAALRAMRVNRRVPLLDVAAAANRSRSHVYKVERGERPATPAIRDAYERVTGCSLDGMAPQSRNADGYDTPPI